MAICSECKKEISFIVLLKTGFFNQIKYAWKVPLSFITKDGWYVRKSTLVTCPYCFTLNLSTRISLWVKAILVILLATFFVTVGNFLGFTMETRSGFLFILGIPVLILYPLFNYIWWKYFIQFEIFGVDIPSQ